MNNKPKRKGKKIIFIQMINRNQEINKLLYDSESVTQLIYAWRYIPHNNTKLNWGKLIGNLIESAHFIRNDFWYYPKIFKIIFFLQKYSIPFMGQREFSRFCPEIWADWQTFIVIIEPNNNWLQHLFSDIFSKLTCALEYVAYFSPIKFYKRGFFPFQVHFLEK